MTSEVTPLINPKPATLILSSEETLMLWQLINAQGVAVPPVKARVTADVYDKLFAAADHFGHVKT